MHRTAAPLPTGSDKVHAVDEMFDTIASRYDRLNRFISLGLDSRWRRRAVRALALPPGARVLDVGCGTGDLCRDLATSGLRPVGIDRSHGMLAAARTTAPLVRGDALALPVPDRALDGVISGFVLRNLVSLEPFLSECARVLRPGGRLVLLEVGAPRHRLARRVHALYFEHVVPLIGGALSDRDAYRYLPRSVAYLPPEDELLAAIRRAGFSGVEAQPLSLGAARLLLGTRT